MSSGAREKLRANIIAAFGRAVQAPRGRLVVGESGQGRRIENMLRGVSWTAHRDKPLDLFQAEDICFLSAEAFVHFLPVILLGAVVEYERADTLPGDLLTSLDSFRREEPDCLRGLTSEMRETLRDALRLLRDEHAADLQGGYPLRQALDWVEGEAGWAD